MTLKNFLKSTRKSIISALGGYTEKRYPTSFQAVDIVVIKPAEKKMLVGYKWSKVFKDKPDTRARIIGGFVDPRDSSLEYAALRELYEEADLGAAHVGPLKYVDSFRVDDPRYRNSPDKIMSAIFVTKMASSCEPHAGDDIARTEWIDIRWMKQNYFRINPNTGRLYVVAEHHDLIEILIDKGII